MLVRRIGSSILLSRLLTRTRSSRTAGHMALLGATSNARNKLNYLSYHPPAAPPPPTASTTTKTNQQRQPHSTTLLAAVSRIYMGQDDTSTAVAFKRTCENPICEHVGRCDEDLSDLKPYARHAKASARHDTPNPQSRILYPSRCTMSIMNELGACVSIQPSLTMQGLVLWS